MVRLARKESPTGYYHVMMRGNNKERIFNYNAEKLYFIEQLKDQVEKGNIKIAAYCIMNNHVHLLLHSELENMVEALKWVNTKFAIYYNKKYERVGHVFQGRFKSEVIDSEGYLIRAIRYIHNNPVKAKIVTKAEDYYWSSYKEYIKEKNNLIDTEEKEMILSLFSYSIEEFAGFHVEEEMEEFLEVKEDLLREREEKAQRIINKYLQKYGLKSIDEAIDDKTILHDIAKELIKYSHLSHRRIAELIGLSRGIIHNISKKIK